jgi:hypothetical protein
MEKKIKQKNGLKRDTIDKYYTKNTVADICINLIKKYINITPTEKKNETKTGFQSYFLYKCLK